VVSHGDYPRSSGKVYNFICYNKDMKQLQLSVVVPAFDEAKNLPVLVGDLQRVLAEYPDHEIIIVNDGSHDNTVEVVKDLNKKDKRIQLLGFTRNFGKEIATTAGITAAKGQAILTIDADGQFPPDLIPEFIKKWQEGAPVVIGLRQSEHKDGVLKRLGTRWFYKILSRVARTPITPHATDFRLIDQEVQQDFIRFTEHNRMSRALIDWMGYPQVFIPFQINQRMSGKPSYSTRKLFKLATDSFVSLSMAPLYFSGYAGIVITPLAFLLGSFVIVEQLLLGDPWHLKFTGTAMLAIALLFFVGILLISQGLVALYISHIHTESQHRPLYILDRRHSWGVEAGDGQ